MQSANPDNFFESDAAYDNRERKAAKASNKHGNPIVMKSKILAAVSDTSSPSSSIFVAESAGCLRRVRLDSSEPTTVYRGPSAPLTCLALGGNTIFAGSWDKDIWTWDISSAQPGRKLSGHNDFVKALVLTKLSGKEILISGGSDKKILVWDLETGRRLHTLQDPSTTMLAVQNLAIDPVLSTPESVVVVSASSDPNIRRWRITRDGFEQLTESFHDRPTAERLTIKEHETSVYRLYFDTSDECDLWTASADGTARCLPRARNFVTEDVFTHGDYVRAVVATDQWVVTAGRDENVKVWDRSSGKLYCTLDGHFEEVTDLLLLPNASGRFDRVCSVGIDCTIRTWPLGKAELDQVVEEMKAPPKNEEVEKKKEGMLTAEEEAELAELMDD